MLEGAKNLRLFEIGLDAAAKAKWAAAAALARAVSESPGFASAWQPGSGSSAGIALEARDGAIGGSPPAQATKKLGIDAEASPRACYIQAPAGPNAPGAKEHLEQMATGAMSISEIRPAAR